MRKPKETYVVIFNNMMPISVSAYHKNEALNLAVLKAIEINNSTLSEDEIRSSLNSIVKEKRKLWPSISSILNGLLFFIIFAFISFLYWEFFLGMALCIIFLFTTCGLLALLFDLKRSKD